MEESFEQFRKERQKGYGSGRKKFKVSGSYGVYDVYKKLRKTGWPGIGKHVDSKDFYAIIRGINSILAEEIAKGTTIYFPAKMGRLELRKYQKGVSFVNGKLHNTYPVDWKRTFELWYEDPEAKEKKIVIRDEQPWVYHVKYCKFRATYENKTFYQFVVNTFIKDNLRDNIVKGKIDTLW